MRNQIKFNTHRVTQSQLREAAISLVGLGYAKNNEAYRDISFTKWEGKLNCFGVPLLVAKIAGLVDSDFDLNLSEAVFGQEKPLTLIEIIRKNFRLVYKEGRAKNVSLENGDLIIQAWRDVNPSIQIGNHAGIFIEAPENGYLGDMIHAHDAASGGTNTVERQPMNLVEFARITRAYRLKGVVKD